MWNTGTGTSLCWLQGEVETRVDPYKKARKEAWKINRVKVKNLKIANYWGDEYTEKLPKTMVVDLSKKNAWALGAEITLDTKGEDEGLIVDLLKEIPEVGKDFDDDGTETREEKGAAGGIEIMENNENENNAETIEQSWNTK